MAGESAKEPKKLGRTRRMKALALMNEKGGCLCSSGQAAWLRNISTHLMFLSFQVRLRNIIG
jgi:hypothetical protein